VKWLRKWRERRKRRLAEIDPAERQRILDEQSPVKAKWGFYPK
jgi:hypothetical protein